jgi:hypothetical protein
MTPIKPIIPGVEVPTVTYAENQPEYIPLPAYRTEDGMAVTRWRMTWRERLRVFLSGDLWLTILTFNGPLQPVMLDTKCPIAIGTERTDA